MKPKSAEVVFAYVTFSSEDVAAEICEALVQDHTIACANLLPAMRSIYRWKGEIQNERECAAILKTSIFKKEVLKERIREIHPYDNPCLVFLQVTDGLPDFLNWIYTESV